MKENNKATEKASRTREVPKVVSTADLVEVVKKGVKRSLAFHFNPYYFFYEKARRT